MSAAAAESQLAKRPRTEEPDAVGGEAVKMAKTTVDAVYLWHVYKLSEHPDCPSKNIPNTRGWGRPVDGSQTPARAGYNQLLGDDNVILHDIVRKPFATAGDSGESRAFLRAGPREVLHFEPPSVSAAIVTCGGLCPGLNNVIRELTLTLINLYGVSAIYGVRNGYQGFHPNALPPLMLTEQVVHNIHHDGGTILGSSRGGFDSEIILSKLKEWGVSMVFIIGGDGTHRGAQKLHTACVDSGENLAVIGIPKTIDNDIGLIDRSFGFNTAVEEACKAVRQITCSETLRCLLMLHSATRVSKATPMQPVAAHQVRSAKVEASCAPNGVGIVKLMGRSAGFIAAHACLSSGDVDLCLIPEAPIHLDGNSSCLEHVFSKVQAQGHAVVVVSEGAGEELLGAGGTIDQAAQAAGAHQKLPPIGEYMKDQIVQHMKKKDLPASIKYIDPSYMIRSVPANAADALYCMLLGQNAVHAAMAGYSGCSVGLCNNRIVLIPITALGAQSPRNLSPYGRTWERVLGITSQPRASPPGTAQYWSEKGTGRTIF